jgi:hypothetical protein
MIRINLTTDHYIYIYENDFKSSKKCVFLKLFFCRDVKILKKTSLDLKSPANDDEDDDDLPHSSSMNRYTSFSSLKRYTSKTSLVSTYDFVRDKVAVSIQICHYYLFLTFLFSKKIEICF